MNVSGAIEDEHKRRQKLRSIAIGIALAALVVVFYVATIVRLGPNALKKDGMGNRAPITKAPITNDAGKDVGKQAPK
jgi:hypothetical protein